MAASLLSQVRWLLVEHPAVASFRWQPGRTVGATVSFVAAITVVICPARCASAEAFLGLFEREG